MERKLAKRMSSKALHARNRINTSLAQSVFDAVVAISPENTLYSSGVWIATQVTIRDRLALVVWPRSGDPAFIMCDIEEGYSRAQSWISDMRPYREHIESPIARLADVLKEKGLSNARIGIETGYLSARYWNELVKALPAATIGPAEPVFDAARMIKSEEEIATLVNAALLTEEALLASYLCIRAGETERSMAQRLASNLLLKGADTIAFLHMPAGPNTGYPHPSASDYQVKLGDLIKTDFGGTFDGYVSDRARTMVVGKPTPEQKSMHDRLVEIHRETLDVLRAGTPACEVFRIARDAYRRLQIPFDPPHAGHSLGLSVHEPPMLNTAFDTVLAPGMVLAIETRMRVAGEYGMHIEDLVEITAAGPKVHTRNYPYDQFLSV